MMYAVSLLWLVTSPAGIDGAAPFTQATFDEACTLAKVQAKQVLIYFGDPGTSQDQVYRELTWSDKKVQRWITENTTAIEVVGERAEPLRKRFEVRSLPTVLIVSPDGVVHARVVGFRDAEKLLSELVSTLKASDPVALALRRVETDSTNPTVLLMYARTLAESGRLDDALSHYRRSFDLGSDSPSGFGGIQLVVIDELGRLAVEHRAAQKALLDRRDASRTRLLAGQGSRSDPAVLAAANVWLDDLDDTLFVVARMRTEWPDSVRYRLLRECAVASAVKMRDYEHIPDVIDILEHAD
ncbi:MAG: thioredoxin family protein, partial [Planctomycetes bacterium]|nr:thioredoxin family protein [Planctomycetota bacterium]